MKNSPDEGWCCWRPMGKRSGSDACALPALDTGASLPLAFLTIAMTGVMAEIS